MKLLNKKIIDGLIDNESIAWCNEVLEVAQYTILLIFLQMDVCVQFFHSSHTYYTSTSLWSQISSHTPWQPCQTGASITVMKVLCCSVIDLKRTRCPRCLPPLSHFISSHISLCLRTPCCVFCYMGNTQSHHHNPQHMVCGTRVWGLKWIWGFRSQCLCSLWRLAVHLAWTPGWMDCNHIEPEHIKSRCRHAHDALRGL